MTETDSRVDAFLARAEAWTDELTALRELLLAAGLEESLKWGKPCYGLDGANVAILQPFRRSCALMFFRGSELEDPDGHLRSPGPNSQLARRLEFDGANPIRKGVVRGFLRQAKALARASRGDGAGSSGAKSGGARAARAPARPALELPDELARALRASPPLGQAFRALTPGRQRSHALYVGGAKQASTRATRAERCAAPILAGKGWNER